MTRPWYRLALGCVGLLALAGLVFAGFTAPERSLEERTREVAQTLKCLTCIGEDVADSTAPVAAAMRMSISEQIELGKSPQEIRQWFADRYGPGVLLEPPMAGTGLLMWLLPASLIGCAAWCLFRQARNRSGWIPLAAVLAIAAAVLAWRIPQGGSVLQAGSAEPTDNTESLLSQAVADAPGDISLHLAYGRELQRQDRHSEAAVQYATAARLDPYNVEIIYLEASALVRAGAPESAVPHLERNLQQKPDHSPSLLLLGTLQARSGNPGGAELLERFLVLNDGHPSADDVRKLIETVREVNP
ncbi:hypothetical protein GCM10027404_26060 [Arthrobacter tumbae]|uniref:cytochrome c-type biogenesis protein CcmH n=1 Tax=Arthrobacter tumbae TaxID=163874 RepID=UPI00195D7B39|nr:cytochrome c-type biogenesis protein [Arthrobacter tumbae]MBM7781629.1 cytochrome c-type biogenesis protein CcmH/NrfF [Arthrobacter tumbae]